MSKEDINKDENQFSGDEKNKEFLGLPDNYFESFSSRLFKKIEAEDELKDYPLLSSVGKTNPFIVPADYFSLHEELLQYPSLFNLKTQNFIVPNNYFNELQERILNAIEIEEENNLYPTLSSIGKQNVFVTPENYFEELNIHIETKEAKVVSLFARIKTTYKVAMAAAVALIVSLSILFYNENTTVKPSNDCNSVACLSKKEILNSNYMQAVSEENIIEMIDVKALSDSLSLKKNGKSEKIKTSDISDEVDVNTITEAL